MTRETTILALDATGAACSVAICASDSILAHRYRPMVRGHAEALVPMVEETLGATGLGFAAITAVAVTVGPGSFTGVRAGLAAARGFALARDLPLIGVDSFEAIAHAVPERQRAGRVLIVAIDTRRRDLYLQAFDPSGGTVVEARVVRPDAAPDCLPCTPLAVTGDGRKMLLPLLGRRDLAEIELDAPDARDVALIAARRIAQRSGGRAPLPLYLREPAAVVPKLGGRLRA